MELNLIHLGKDSPTTDYLSMYRLRYQTYCVESQFIDKALYPNGFESDEYDAISEHFILKLDDETIGTVRLIKWDSKLPFPTSLHFDPLVQTLQSLNYPIETTAEISRLCVLKKYRKDVQCILELFKGIYLESLHNNKITHWIGSFEVPLARMLHKYGIYFTPITPHIIEYYGKVKIYGASFEYFNSSVRVNRPDLVPFFTNT